MVGLTGYLGIALAAAVAVAGASSWAALHEYGVAQSQAARDAARIAQVQAQAAGRTLAAQQAIDAAQAAHVHTLYARGTSAVAWLGQFAGVQTQTAHSGHRTIRTIIRTEPATACARQTIPAPILDALHAR